MAWLHFGADFPRLYLSFPTESAVETQRSTIAIFEQSNSERFHVWPRTQFGAVFQAKIPPFGLDPGSLWLRVGLR